MNSARAFSQSILEAIRRVTGEGEHQLHVPDLTDEDRQSVSCCFDQGFVSSVGPLISNLKKRLVNTQGQNMRLLYQVEQQRFNSNRSRDQTK